MSGRHLQGSVFSVAGLVVKEKIGLKLAQKFALGQAAKVHGFVNLDVPVHELANGASVGWGAAGGFQGRANSHGAGAFRLLAVQRFERGLERLACQRLSGVRRFVGLDGGEPLAMSQRAASGPNPYFPANAARTAAQTAFKWNAAGPASSAFSVHCCSWKAATAGRWAMDTSAPLDASTMSFRRP